MGKYDTCMKAYLQNKERFADLFNGSCFQGKQVIRAEDLQDASEGYVISENRKSEIFRDVKMTLRSGMILQVLAVENQSYIDYGMPVRCMGYDAAEYSRQLKEKKQKHRLLMTGQNKTASVIAASTAAVTSHERLSGVLKTDRLQPVYTLCLYSGIDPWDGPRTLSDMMTFNPESSQLRFLFRDYQLNLFCINEHNAFEEFHTDLRLLFRAMNCRKDKQKLTELMMDMNYSYLSEETWDAIAVMTDNAAIIRKKDMYKTENDEEGYNMCQALEELMADNRKKGERKGVRKGVRQGKQEQQYFTIRQMLNENFEVKDICRMVGCNVILVEEVRKNEDMSMKQLHES